MARRFSTLLCLALLALCAALAVAQVPHATHAAIATTTADAAPALRGAAEPLLQAKELPVLTLDEASSTHNDTAAATVAVPEPTTHQAPVPVPVPPVAPARNLHPVFALIMVALVLCVTNNVSDRDTIAAISSTAGILTTVYTLVLGLEMNASVGLALVTIAGGSIGTFVDNVRECARDVAARPLIDWDLLLVLQPTLMLGVLFGVFVRYVLVPSWLLSTLLATMLLICGSLLLQASHRRTEHEAPEELSINEGSSLVNAQAAPHSGPAPPFSVAIQAVPLDKLGVLVGVIFGVAVLQAALVVVVPIVLLGYLAYKSFKTTADSFERQQLPRSTGEIKWTSYNIKMTPVISLLSGVATGAVGFGSDLVFVPYIVETGLDRAVAGATGSTIVLLCSLMAAMECIVLGHVSFTVAVLALILGFVVKMWGHMALERGLSDHLRTPSFLAVSFAACTLIAGIALAISNI